MDTTLAVLLYVVLAIAPSLLFLGLWEGLNYLRDDELTRKAIEHAERERQETNSGFGFISVNRNIRKNLIEELDVDEAELGDTPSDPAEEQVIHCTDCGAENPATTQVCLECYEPFDEELAVIGDQ